MRTPESHHNKSHRDVGVPFEECRVCQRDRATCERKIYFSSWDEARAWVDDRNLSREYQPPLLARYRCRWCPTVRGAAGWHLKTARDVRTQARVERQRRKWRAAQTGAGA